MSTIQETIATLKEYNKWRRGDETITMPDPFEVGVAIGDAVRLLSELETIRSEFEKIVLIAGQKADSNVELRLRAEKAEAALTDPQQLHVYCLRTLNEGQISHLFGERMTEIVNRAEKAEADTKRLDWIASRKSTELVYFAAAGWSIIKSNGGDLLCDQNIHNFRDAIDTAMKEAKNESI